MQQAPEPTVRATERPVARHSHRRPSCCEKHDAHHPDHTKDGAQESAPMGGFAPDNAPQSPRRISRSARARMTSEVTCETEFRPTHDKGNEQAQGRRLFDLRPGYALHGAGHEHF